MIRSLFSGNLSIPFLARAVLSFVLEERSRSLLGVSLSARIHGSCIMWLHGSPSDFTSCVMRLRGKTFHTFRSVLPGRRAALAAAIVLCLWGHPTCSVQGSVSENRKAGARVIHVQNAEQRPRAQSVSQVKSLHKQQTRLDLTHTPSSTMHKRPFSPVWGHKSMAMGVHFMCPPQVGVRED